MPTEPEKSRPPIAPDDENRRRAVIVSRADLEELAWEYYQRGIASTCVEVHGETPQLDDPRMRAVIRAGFELLWSSRRNG